MIEHAILLSLICFGVHCVTREGNALGYWETLTADSDGNQISEMFNPLTECVLCMPSFWGVMYFTLLGFIPLTHYMAFVIFTGLIIIASMFLDKYDKFFNIIYLILFFFVIVSVGPQCKTVFVSVICSVGANFLSYEFINK